MGSFSLSDKLCVLLVHKVLTCITIRRSLSKMKRGIVMAIASVYLSEIVKAFDLEVVCDPGNLDQIRITVADVTRPGLQLAGYFDHFGPDRIQLIGNMESAYLDKLSSEIRRKRLNALFSRNIPCLILTRNHEPHPELIPCAKRKKIPILRTKQATSEFMSSLVKHLNIERRLFRYWLY